MAGLDPAMTDGGGVSQHFGPLAYRLSAEIHGFDAW
jgi:hypothetical protein